MKRNSILLFAAAALFAVSCSDAESTEENTAEEVSYTADVANSTINWRGAENDEHFHTGTIKLKEGSLTMKGDELISGSFTVDMNSISAATEGYPAEKMAYLNAHLKDTAFFFTADHPEVMVEALSYKEGKMNAKFTILGVELEQEVPVTITQDDKGAAIAGKFTLDISKTKMPYLSEKNEGGGPALKPGLEFEIDLKLNKK